MDTRGVHGVAHQKLVPSQNDQKPCFSNLAFFLDPEMRFVRYAHTVGVAEKQARILTQHRLLRVSRNRTWVFALSV